MTEQEKQEFAAERRRGVHSVEDDRAAQQAAQERSWVSANDPLMKIQTERLKGKWRFDYANPPEFLTNPQEKN